MDHMGEPVKLSDASGWNLNLSKEILLKMDEFWDSIWLDNDLIEFSSKNRLDLIKDWLASSIDWLWQHGELLTVSSAPVELLFTEILLS